MHEARNTITAESYAVFGNPVAQSVSPQIHREFARQTGQTMYYGKQLVEADGFESAVQEFFAGGGGGLNITAPFKQRAFAIASRTSATASHAGAVNTLYQKKGILCGDNTDGAGLCNDLQNNLAWPVAGQRVLLLGAGGAVRGVLGSLLACAPASLVIANRSVEKATALAQHFKVEADTAGVVLTAIAPDEINESFDLVINATSASLDGSIPALAECAVNHARCYDMVYAATPTPFLRWAARAGARGLADGLGMLVEQAAESFNIWRGVRPQTRPVIDQLRAELAG